MVHQTKVTKPVSGKDIQRDWVLIDLKNKILGRAANQIAVLLQGKHKVTFVRNLDFGDHVVVINAQKVKFTGRKLQQKDYTFYSGYPGGLRTISLQNLLAKNPKEVIRHAVSGMLPKNKLRDQRLKRLYIYTDENHPYADKVKH